MITAYWFYKRCITHLDWRIQHLKRRFVERYLMLPYDKKRLIIIRYAKDNCLKKFIETGTFLGDTVAAVLPFFENLYTIELNEELASNAKERFKHETKIKVIPGDSSVELEHILQKNHHKICFWLDGHYSHSCFVQNKMVVTAKGEKQTPIVAELETIFKYCKKECVILIDDARLFTGRNDYPTYKNLRQIIFNYHPQAVIKKSRDIIRVFI